MQKLSKWLPRKRKDEGQTALAQRQNEHPLLRMQAQMDSLFEDFLRNPWGLTERPWAGLERLSAMTGLAEPKIDIEDKRKEIKVSVELPGLEPDDVDLRLTDEALTIRGEKRTEDSDEGDGYYLSERTFGAFERSVPLPVEVDADRAEAKFKKGVLTVRLPKTERARKSARKVEVK